MALFSYYALAKNGKRVRGQLDASSAQSVREQIVKMGLYPVSIDLAKSAEGASGASGLWTMLTEKPVPPKDIILFTKQLAVLLRSGVPLLQALELLIEQFGSRFRGIIINLKDGIKEGQSLASGMARYPNVFENIYVQLIRAGEATGKLEIILDRLTDYFERREVVRKRVSGALRPALIQLAFIFIIAGFLTTFVLPNIAKTFSKFGSDLPWNTKLLLGISDLIINHYILLGLIIGAIVFAVRSFLKSERGRIFWDRVKLSLPLVKYFARMNAIVQFCSTLGMLLESGVNLSEALDIVCKIVDNRVLANTLMTARDKIIKEGKIAQYLKQTGIFPPMAIYLINTGEQTGKLDTMLLTVSSNYETELLELSDKLSEQIGPFMMLITGAVVGFIVFAIIQPMFGLNDLAMKRFNK